MKTNQSQTEPAEVRENIMGTMEINPLLLKLSIPMMISMLVQALYNVVDSVFVYAPKEWRLQYAKTNPLVKAKDEKGIKEEVEKTDRNRSAYYNYYTQNRWGDAHNYDLAINAALGRETCVKMILDAAAAKEKTL